MRVLYAIQGTGNGHLCRARAVVPTLRKYCQVDVLVSGTQGDINLPFEVNYKLKGLSFVFGKKGGVDFMETLKLMKPEQFRKEMSSLPVDKYDLVINDFEPVSAWSAFLHGVPCISLSHQSAVINKNSPRPTKKDYLGKMILENYAPVQEHYGFHFEQYDNRIFTPIIRPSVRELQPTNKGHYTVYLPSFSNKKLLNKLQHFKGVKWEVFSKHCKKTIVEGDIKIMPVNNDAFIESMASSEGVLCGAGFETPAEALFLNKKLMVIPMKNQYEQQCNAAALAEMGIPVIPSLKKKHFDIIQSWLDSHQVIEVNYPDNIDVVVQTVLEDYAAYKTSEAMEEVENILTLRENTETLETEKIS